MANLLVTTLDDEDAGSTDLATESADGAGLSLREALAIANADAAADTITFAPGLSGGTLTLLSGQLSISNSVTIDGDLDDDGIPDITVDAAGSSRVLQITSGTSTLDGLTVTNGTVTGSARGGGIHIGSGSDVTITNSVVSNNTSASYAGGVYSRGDLTISNSSFTGNSAGGYGGGISAHGGDLTIANSSFTNNSAGVGGVASGGAVHSSSFGNTFTLSDSTIAQNTATGLGAGVTSNNNTIISNSTITGNSSSVSSQPWYQLYVWVTDVSISNSNIAASGTFASSIRNSRSDITFSGTNVLSSPVGTPHYNHSNTGTYTIESTLSNIFASTQTLNSVEGGALVVSGILSSAPINASGPAANNAPAIGVDNVALAFTEGDSAAQIDSAGTLADADGDAEWAGGGLTVQITGNANATDQISISDTDGDGIAITVSGTDILANGVDIGDLSASGGTVTGGTALMITFDADATNANVQEVLQSLTYSNTSNDPGSLDRTVTVRANDSLGANGSDTRTIAVTAVNEDPTISGLVLEVAVTEDTASNLDLSASSFGDIDSAGDITVTLAAGTGTMAASDGGGVVVGGTGTGTLTLVGTVAEINTYLDTASNIQYTGAADVTGDNATSVSVTANDGDGSGDVALGTVNIDITAVNDNPSISGLVPDITVTEDTGGDLDLSASAFADVDSTGDIIVTLAAGSGTLAASDVGGVVVGGTGTDTLTLTGTVTEINTYLDTASNVQYTGAADVNGTGATSVSVSANDDDGSGDVALGSVSIDISATNDLPTGADHTTELAANTPESFGTTIYTVSLPDFGFNDVDGDSFASVRVDTLNLAPGDIFTNGGVPIQPGDVITLKDIDDGDIRYTSVDDGFGVARTSFTFSVNDGTSFASTPSTFNFNVAQGNQSPVNANSTVNSTKGATYVFSEADFNFTDPDAGDTFGSVQVTNLNLAAGDQLLAYGSAVENGDVFSLSELIGGELTYIPAANVSGAARLTFDFIVMDNHSRPADAGATFTLNVPNDENSADVVSDPVNLHGDIGSDTLTGGSANDTLIGGAGDDSVSGGGGDDILFAGPDDNGNDTVSGGAGDDIVGGGAGDDFIEGGDGSDTLYGGTGNDTIFATSKDNENGDTSTNTVWAGSGHDSVSGGLGNDTLGGGSGDDQVEGGSGSDTLYGSAGDDTLAGDAGNDTLFGGADADDVAGGGGDDLLFGGGGNDTVSGGDGSDTLWAGAGDDMLMGGAGADTFVFGAVSGNDQITDFGLSEDILDLRFSVTDFADLAAVEAAATVTSIGGTSGVLIDLGDGNSVFLEGLVLGDFDTINLVI